MYEDLTPNFSPNLGNGIEKKENDTSLPSFSLVMVIPRLTSIQLHYYDNIIIGSIKSNV